MAVSREERLRIAAETLCDLRTVTRYCEGNRVSPVTEERIVRAARTLGIALPRHAPTVCEHCNGTGKIVVFNAGDSGWVVCRCGAADVA